MRSNRFIWQTAVALLLVAAMGWLLRPHRAQPPPKDQAALASTTPGSESKSFRHLPDAPAESGAQPAPATGSAPDTATNFLQRLRANAGEMDEATRAHITPWLTANRTNAESLLAVRQAGGGLEFLRTALTNFPNDPRVLFSALALDDSAEAKRERLDRLKAVAPDNALADYLSAGDHLKHSRPEEALKDLMAASQKSHFQDYMQDAVQNCEEFYLAAGKSPTEAKALACSTALLPHLAQLKGLAVDLAAQQRQYLAAGDTTSAENLALYGLQLNQHLTAGEGSRTLIGQLVGIATARLVLEPLNREPYQGLLDGTVRERLAALAAQKATFRQNSQFVDQWMNSASESELGNYFERLKLYGESGATDWLKQRQTRQ